MNGRKIKILLFSLIMSVLATFGAIGCGEEEKPSVCSHTWSEATCTAPKTCTKCQKTEGEALGHSWVDANCTTPKTCSVCQTTEGEANGHTGGTATCTDQAVCTVCSTPYGEVNATNHTGEEFTYVTNGNGTHTKKYACCGAIAVADEACTGGAATCQVKAVCQYCNTAYGSLGAHEYDLTEWGFTSAEGHAHACKTAGCTEHDTVVAHTPGNAATETEPQLCLDCEYVVNPATGHINHTPEGEWSKDKDNHWKECIGCEDKEFEKAAHDYTDDCDTTCNTCGWERTITHQYTDLKKSDTEHWYECSVCHIEQAGSRVGHSGGEATCTDKAVCTVCTQAYGAVDATNHAKDTFVYQTNGDGTHTKKHECCGSVAVADEACTGGTATCTAKAVCTVCSAAYGAVDADNHTKNTFIYVTNNNGTHTKKYECCTAVAATESCTGGTASCTAKAICEYCNTAYGNFADHTGGEATCQTQAICSTCNNPYGGLAQHEYVEENPVAAYICDRATCTTAATYYKSCACGEKGQATFSYGDALGHDYGEWVVVNGVHTKTCKNDPSHVISDECAGGTATCEEPAICSECGHSYGAALGHEYGEWTETVPATCTEAGKKEATCTRADCGDVTTETIDAKGHTYTDVVTQPTCTEKGYTTKTCACGDVQIVDYVDETGHTWNLTAPTCTQGQTCIVDGCGALGEPALGHDEKTEITPATCTEDEIKTVTCKRENCEYLEVEKGEKAKGHNIVGVTPTREATGNPCEYVEVYVCSVATCGAEVRDTEHPIKDHGENFAAVIDTAATCQTTGVMKYVCTLCNDEKDETGEIPVDPVTGHNWVRGEDDANGNEVYTCTVPNCGQSKTVTVVSKDQTVNVDDIKNNELKLDGGANVNLGEAANDASLAGKDVSILAGTVDKDTLSLTPEQLAQVANSEVYNFSIVSNGENISSFGGKKITVSLPYELKNGDNVDRIAVWYIDEDGKLSSDPIYGTFNNGYVTFETNHFSYYTVTELTPEERCNFYGHNYATKVKEATCTEAGYTLVYCLRCGEFEKTEGDPALGHNYQYTEAGSTAATCTKSGKAKYVCQNCSHAYFEIVAAFKHSWVESEEASYAATCTSTGRRVFVCENEGCGGQQVKILAQLSHSLTSQEIAPTCDTTGYTLHTCGNEGCSYSYQDTITQPLGHAYGYEFEWNEDFASATLVATCSREGCNHTESVEVLKISITDFAASCDSYGYYEYVARVTHNGKVHEDRKHKEHENKEYLHSYGNHWKHDGGHHWYECDKCGGRDEAHTAEHSFGEGTIVKRATCSDDGIVAYACACGYVKTEIIAKTGAHEFVATELYSDKNGHWNVCSICGMNCNTAEHDFSVTVLKAENCADDGEKLYQCATCHYAETVTVPATGNHVYENGVCGECGGVESDCTHEVLTQKTLDLSAYGTCTTEVLVNVCDCGLVIELADFYAFIECCAWNNESVDLETGVDENGNFYQKGTMVCAECNAEMDVYATMTEEGCTYTLTYTLTMRNAEGVTVFENATASETHTEHYSDNKSERVEIPGGCGGYYYVEVCKDCGEVINIYNFTPCCNIADGSGVIEKFVDENGVEHTVGVATCPDCGLRCEIDMYTEVRSACVWVDHFVTSFYDGDTLVVKHDEEQWTDNHEWKETIEKYGDKCTDGYKVTRYCEHCGESESYTSKEHRSNYFEQNLASYGTCGGLVAGEACSVCGEVIRFKEFNLYCEMSESVTTSYEDENGVVHQVITSSCSACGLIATTDSWTEQTLCTVVMHSRGTFTMGEQVLFFTTQEQVIEDKHDYQTSVEKFGETCEDGYRMTISCSVCGLSETYTSAGHYIEEVVLNLSDYGACEGKILYYACKICGEKIGMASEPELGCDINFEYVKDGEMSSYEDENGITHITCTLVCTKCGLEFRLDSWVEGEASCTSIEYSRYSFVINGTTVLEACNEMQNDGHTWVDSYEMMGETCEDGFIHITTCTVCGERVEHGEYSGHYYRYQEIDLSPYSSCGGYARGEVCIGCGRLMNDHFDIQINCGMEDASMTEITDENGNMRYVQELLCSNCGLFLRWETWKEEDSVCVYRDMQRMYIAKDGEVLLDWTMVDESITHEYEQTVEMLGDTCADGIRVTYYCPLCEDGHFDLYNDCYYVYTHYDFSALGVGCGGYANVSQCVGCGEFDESQLDFYCKFEETGVTEDGYTLYTCSNCGTVLQQKISYAEKDENCYLVKTQHTMLLVNGEIIFDVENSERYEKHAFSEEVVMHGESCTDGVEINFTCEYCGYSYGESFHDHRTHAVYTLADTGVAFCEYHVFNVMECYCGKESHVEHEFYDGRVDYTCAACSFRLVATVESLDEGCRHVETTLTVLYSGETEIYRHERVYDTYSHTMNVTATTVNGIAVITATCESCGLTTSYGGNGQTVTLAYNEKIGEYCYDLTFAPEASGYYTVYSVGYTDTVVELYLLRNGNEEYLSSDDDGGVGNNFRLTYYLEAGVSYVYRMRTYGKEEGAQATVTYVFEQSNGGNEGFGCAHYEETFYILPEGVTSCEDGLLCVRVCNRCGEIIEAYVEYGHYSTTMHYDLSEYGACYGYISVNSCPCGEYGYWSRDWGCYNDTTQNSYEDENGICHNVETYLCSDCGKVLTVDFYETVEGCARTLYVKIEMSINDEVKLSITAIEYREYSHEYEYSYVFDRTDVENNCEDGVTITGTCVRCGNTYHDYNTYHSIYLQQVIDLSEYGACEGELRLLSCPCGKETTLETNYSCWGEQTTDSYEDEEGNLHSVTVTVCENCGLRWERDEYSQKIGCEKFFYTTYTFQRNDVVIVNGYLCARKETAHNWEYQVEFDNPSDAPNCEEGVRITRVCPDCGESYEEGYYTWHREFGENYDLSEYGACGGNIDIRKCACGLYGDVNMNTYNCMMTDLEPEIFEDDKGVTHTVYTSTCENCGLVIVRDEYTAIEGCYQNSYNVYTVTVNGVDVLCEYKHKYYSEMKHVLTTEFTFLTDTQDCEAGVRMISICANCDYEHVGEYYHHEATLQVAYDLAEYGACGGTFEQYACACGKDAREATNWYCRGNWTSENYLDDEGRMHYVEAFTCNTCGFRYQKDSYTVKDEATCAETTYYRCDLSSASAGLIGAVEYTTTFIDHNYVASGVLDEGATTCEQGVLVTYTCQCGASYTEHWNDHHRVEIARYDLQDPAYGGSNHVGYGIVTGCVCGKYSSVSYESLCEFGGTSVSCWVDGHLTTNKVYEAENNGYIYYDRNAYVMTCAVTDPQCGYRIRYATYYLPVAGQCLAEQWTTWQFGYNDQTGECAYEISVRTGYTKLYHHLVETSLDENYASGTSKVRGSYYECSVCGSSRMDKTCYQENGKRVSYEYVIINALENGRAKKYFEYYEYAENGSSRTLEKVGRISASGIETWTLDEYSYDESYWVLMHKTTRLYESGKTSVEIWEYGYDENYRRILEKHAYTSTENETTVDLWEGRYDENGLAWKKQTHTAVDGTVTWEETEYVRNREYTYELGGELCNGYEELTNKRNSGGKEWSVGYAEAYYKGYTYIIYSLHEEEYGYWYRYDYTYNFDGTCEATEVYENSYGDWNENSYDCHHTYWERVKEPTCTQDGLEADFCYVCENQIGEGYVLSPHAHYWAYVMDNLYYCTTCGLENINGADGDIVFEDLTALYGEGVNYVAGYWKRNDVQFINNVSLILHTPLEDGNSQIDLTFTNFIELTEVRAIAFSKAEVFAMATALGYEEGTYDVRFAFVPFGADERHDYAITFTEEVNVDAPIVGTTTRKIFVNGGETATVAVNPPVGTNGQWKITISEFYGEVALYDANGERYYSLWSGSKEYVYLEAGASYELRVTAYDEEKRCLYVSFELPDTNEGGDIVVETDGNFTVDSDGNTYA